MASGYSGSGANAGGEMANASMEQKFTSSTSGKASGSGDCQSAKNVPYIGVWKKFHLDMVIVTKESRKKEDYKDMSSLLSPIKMQFQLKLKFEELKKKVSAQNYRLTQCIEGLKVVVSNPEGRVTFDDIATKLLALLEPMEEGIIVRDLPGKGRPYFTSTKEIVDDLIKQEKVDVFLEGGMKTLLVGNRENVQEALDIIKSVNDQNNAGENIVKLDCSGHADILKKLAFEEEVYQKWGNRISIRMDKNQVMIKGEKKEDRDEVEKKIHRFISDLVVKDKALGELKVELFKKDAVKEYIYGRMSQENTLCYLCTSDDSGVVKIYTRTKDMQQKAVEFLKQLIGELTIPKILADTDKFREFRDSNSNKMLIHEMREQGEHYLITATDDVISEINKMLQKFGNATSEFQQLQQPQMQQMPNQQKESVPYKHEVTLSPTEMNILRVFEKSFSELLLQKCGDISYQIDLNRCCIIFQSYKDICIEGQKVMNAWLDRNDYSSEDICNSLIVEFYRRPAVIDHVNEHLKRKNEHCTWDVDDGGCLHILAESKHVGDRAIQRIKTAVKQVQLDNSLRKCIDTSVEMVQKMQQYGEKAQIFPGTNTEFVLVATDDVCPAIMEELEYLKSILPNTNPDRYVEEYTKVMVGKRKVQYMNKIFQNEIKKLESEYNVKIFPSSDMKSLIVEGTEKNRTSAVKILKCQLSNKIQVTRVNMHHEATDRNRNSVKKIISDMGSTSCQIEEDFCEPDIQFQKCWMKNKGYGRRLIQVLGHVADIETEALFCPTNKSFFPLGEGLNIFLKGGKSMLGGMAADHAKDVITKGGPEKFKEDSVFISTETGHLPCRYIVYGIVSRPPTSPEEQIPKCIEDVFRLCEEKGCNTLALSVDGSNDFECDKFPQLIVHAVVEKFTKYKNLMEIYLCSNDDTLSSKVEQLLSLRMVGLNCIDIDFSRVFPSSRWFVDITNDPKNVQNIGIELDTNGLGSLQVDMVINTASPTLNLLAGAVSKSLLKAGGESIQQECTDNYPQGIKLGQAITTTSGNLKCKKLCHGALGVWCYSGYFSLNLLKLFIINCLSEAEEHGFATVGFPPLGTGNLKYPCQLVASVMYDSVQEYGWRNPETCIQKVIFALHPKDHKVIEVFNAVLHGKDRVRTFEKDIAPEKKILSTWINSNRQNVHIQVLPSHCMRTNTEAIVFFDPSKKSYSQATRSQDITHYWTKDGQLEIKLHKSDIETCPEILEGNRICSVQFIITGSFNQDTKVMIKEIKRAVYQYSFEKAHYLYLSHVYIVFYQQPAFRAFLDHENSKTDKIKKALKEVKAKGSSWFWQSTDKEKPPKWQIVCFNEEPKERDIDVFVMGCDKTEVDKCRKQVVHALDPKTAAPEGYVKDVLQDEKDKMPTEPKSPSIQRDKDDNYQNNLSAGVASQSSTSGRSVTKKPNMPAEPKSPSSRDMDDKFENDLFAGVASQSSTSGRSVTKKPNMFCKITADVNPGFLKLDDETLEKYKTEMKSKFNIEVVLNKQNRSMKLEGICFDDVKRVQTYLLSKLEQMSQSEDERADSIGSDFTGVELVKISQREFDILMYFWGNGYKKVHKDITISYSDQQVVVQCDQPKSENLKKEINNEIDKIRKMTDTEIPIENGQLEKAESSLQTLQSEFQQIYFFLDKDHFILHAVGDYDYGQKQQITHRTKILTGQIKETKRARRFAAGEDIAVIQNDHQSGQDNYKSLPGSLPSRDSFRSSTRHQTRNTDERKKFVTKEGIDIYVYSQSILQLDVDCIVNAANERLGHGAGVAAVIARAAGYELEQEGKNYIRQHGEIPVGECCHTTAGKLPYKYVIHTVGPRWNNNMTFDEQTQCKKELQNAVESCFYEADELGMRSIGVPSVSAGIFGMPPYICARQYCEAVINYSQQRMWSNKPTTLKEIHFIDMNDDMCRQIADVFSKCGELSGKEAGLSGGSKPSSSRHSFSKSSYSRSLSHGSYDSPSLPHGSYDRNEDEAISNSKEIVFHPCSWITIHVLQSSITEVKNVSVVVSPENLGFKHQGRISKDISAKADEEYRDRLEIMKDKPTAMKSVFTLDCTEGMPWKHVVYAIAPRWSSEYAQKNQQFEKDLMHTMSNILSEVQMKGAKSLAVPLLGTARKDMQTPVDTCCRAMLDGIWSIINKGTRAKKWNLDLWIVTTDAAAVQTFEKMLDTRVESKSPKTQQDDESNKPENKTTDNKALDEDCCICMDKITDPKWLPCKHVFCTDCIDQQFKFKPACPQCGAVHGIVTGDQPYGTMSRRTHHYSLSGYPECKTIAITYSFPAGYQTEEHPNPGKPYSGIDRTGYLPDNEKGRLVARLLRAAFDRRLVFTIGRSVTTGQEGVITWNDIHHKTRTHGGPQSFGYPDETYLDRVMGELAAKGVTEDSLKG